MIQGVIDVYSAIKQDLRPTPATAHYVFSLHDIARVFEGMMLMSPKSKVKSKREKMSTLDMTSSRSDFRGSMSFIQLVLGFHAGKIRITIHLSRFRN